MKAEIKLSIQPCFPHTTPFDGNYSHSFNDFIGKVYCIRLSDFIFESLNFHEFKAYRNLRTLNFHDLGVDLDSWCPLMLKAGPEQSGNFRIHLNGISSYYVS